MRKLDRRKFLQHSALLGGTLLSGATTFERSAFAADRIDVPVVDEITVREITDNQYDIFLKGSRAPGLEAGVRVLQRRPRKA